MTGQCLGSHEASTQSGANGSVGAGVGAPRQARAQRQLRGVHEHPLPVRRVAGGAERVVQPERAPDGGDRGECLQRPDLEPTAEGPGPVSAAEQAGGELPGGGFNQGVAMGNNLPTNQKANSGQKQKSGKSHHWCENSGRMEP